MLSVFTVISVVGTYRNLFAVVHLTFPLHKKSGFVFVRGGETFLWGAISTLLPHLKYCILLSCEPGRPYMQMHAAFYKSSQWVTSVRGCRCTSARCIVLPHLINPLWGLGRNASKYVAVFFNWQLMFIGSEVHLCMLSTYLGLFASRVVTKASVACVWNPAAHVRADTQTRADSCSICCWPQLVDMNVLSCSSWCDLCNLCRFAWGLDLNNVGELLRMISLFHLWAVAGPWMIEVPAWVLKCLGCCSARCSGSLSSDYLHGAGQGGL